MSYGPFGAVYNGSRVRPGGGGALAEARVLQEYDFRSDPTQLLVNGPTLVDDLPFVVVNRAAANLFQRNAAGLRISQLASTAAALLSNSQTGPYIYTRLGDIPSWRSGMTLIIEVVVAAYTAGPASVSDSIRVGLFRLAGNPVSGTGTSATSLTGGFRRSATAGNLKCVYHQQDTGNGTAVDANLAAFNSFALEISPDAFMSTAIGDYPDASDTGPWPQFAGTAVALQANSNPMTPDTRLVFGLTCASNVSPLLDFTIERARVRAA